MQVELNRKEIQILDEALVAWEKESTSTAMVGSMFASMLIRDEEKAKDVCEKHMREAASKDKNRKNQSLMLRAKLAQADAQLSEHEINPA